jgi:DNA-binding transcriptional LysR family regulator
MQIKWIEDFLNLVEAGGFSRAARERNISQSALSRHIQLLEEWVGVELVLRQASGIRLTAAGRLFRNFAVDMLQRSYEIRSVLRGQAEETIDTVRFSVAHTLSLTFFPDWLAKLKAVAGPLLARVGAVNIQDGAALLTEGATDILLIYHHPYLPVLLDPDRFPCLTLAVDRLLPLSAPDADGKPLHALPGTPGAALPYLGYSAGTYLAHVVEMILLNASQRCHFARAFETQMAEALKAMVVGGHGLGWLPESSVLKELADGSVVLAGQEPWFGSLEVRVYRSASNSNRLIDYIWSLLSEGNIA